MITTVFILLLYETQEEYTVDIYCFERFTVYKSNFILSLMFDNDCTHPSYYYKQLVWTRS